jgi:outer membrane lipoprotein-sorting protein
MKKILFITILFSVICGYVFPQNGRKLSESEKAVFEQKIVEQSKKITTLQCGFVQEKISTLISEKSQAKGILLYLSPAALRWEYTEPNPSTLIFNDNNAALFDKNGKRIGNEKMLKQLCSLIISMLNGESLLNSKQFASEIFASEKGEFIIILLPIQKRLKEFYSAIEMKIDGKTLLANEIIMNEKSGDKTVISLNNKRLNEIINVDKFVIK